MHVIFQFPIADLRLMNQEQGLRLLRPYWSSPDIGAGKPFIRRFGRLRERKLGGVSGWAAEEHFCDARLSVKYTDIHKNGYDAGNEKKAIINKVYRRLYSDGKFMNKMELGFVDDLEEKLMDTTEGQQEDLQKILDHYCNLPVKIEAETVKLSEAAPLLAFNFARATTYKMKYNADINKLVISGQLNITVVLSPDANIRLPRYAQQVSEYKVAEKTITLYGCKMRFGKQAVKVWMIKVSSITDLLPQQEALKTVLRNLRINLTRIHAEKETLRILLSNIMTKSVQLEPGSKQAVLVRDYVKKTAAKLFAPKRNKLDQHDILQFALTSEELALPGTMESLNETVIDFKDQYTKKVITKMADDLQKTKVRTILYLTASPKGKHTLDIQAELDAIMDKHERGQFRDVYEIKAEPSVEKDELTRFLNKYQPDILHISLHASKIDGLYFQRADQQAAPISVLEFDDIIRTYTKHHRLETVILSACNSLPHASAALPYCKYAMGTNTAIPDEASPIYARYFYETLFDSQNPDINQCHDVAVMQLRQSNLQSPGERPIDQMFELLIHP